MALTAFESIHVACLQYRTTGAAYSEFMRSHLALPAASLPLDPNQGEPHRIVEQVAAQVPLLLQREGDKLVAGMLMRAPPNIDVDRELLALRDLYDGQWLPRRLRQLQALTLECLDA
jgi:hypothetical protein